MIFHLITMGNAYVYLSFLCLFHRMPQQADRGCQHFDDVLRYVGEFGLWQKFLYFSSCFLAIVSSAIQIASLVFATGTPKFHCGDSQRHVRREQVLWQMYGLHFRRLIYKYCDWGKSNKTFDDELVALYLPRVPN